MRTVLIRSILLALLTVFGATGLAGEASARMKSDPNACNSELVLCPEGEQTRVIIV